MLSVQPNQIIAIKRARPLISTFYSLPFRMLVCSVGGWKLQKKGGRAGGVLFFLSFEADVKSQDERYSLDRQGDDGGREVPSCTSSM